MSDMSAIIVPKSDQINADDLQGGRTITVTVTKVTIRGGQEQPISIHLAETDKVYRPCKSMCRVLAQAWGLDSALYAGRSMTLYTDPSVKFGPLAVGGIRISHMSHIDGPLVMALTATKGVKKSYKVLPLEVSRPREQQVDKAAEGVRTLVARIGSLDAKNLQGLLDDPVIVKQRAWLAANRPELAEQVDAAVAAKAPPPPAEIEDDDPFGLPPLTGEETVTEENPTAQEGRPDSERGEELFPSEPSLPEPKRTAAGFVDGLIEKFSGAANPVAIQQLLTDNADEIERLESSAPKQHARLMEARDLAWDQFNG